MSCWPFRKLLFLAFCAQLVLAGPATAQSEAEADPEPAVEITPKPPPPPPDPLLGFDPGAERLTLDTPDGPASALFRAARNGEAKGTIVLIPADTRPAPGSAIEQVYRLLPEHDWDVVLLSLATMPSIRHGQLFTAVEKLSSEDAADPDSDPDSAPEPDPADAPPVATEPDPSSRQPKTFPDWSSNGQARLEAALQTLDARGADAPWLVGEGYGAEIAAQFLATQDASTVSGVAFINPRRPAVLTASWPADPALPALDVLDPRLGTRLAAQRRQLAASSRAEQYQQLRLSQVAPPHFHDDSLISRRLRGWLLRQTKAAQAG